MSADSIRASLGSELEGRLRRSPLDFIREMDPAGDRERWLAELTSSTASENDLTFVIDLDGLGPTGVFAEVLPWDTEFFGFTIARLNAVISLGDPTYQVLSDLGGAVDRLMEICRQQGVRYLFAPVDARDVALSRALTGRGFELIESRLCYHGDLASLNQRGRFPVRLATPEDFGVLAEVAVSIVNPYDRFHADPILNGEPANQMMRRWVKASVCEGFADATLVPDVERPEAFITIRYHKARWTDWGLNIGQPVFGAVAPTFRGWYFKLISEVCHHLSTVQAEHIYLISQPTNNAVLRCWENLGLRYGKTEHILRMAFQ